MAFLPAMQLGAAAQPSNRRVCVELEQAMKWGRRSRIKYMRDYRKAHPVLREYQIAQQKLSRRGDRLGALGVGKVWAGIVERMLG